MTLKADPGNLNGPVISDTSQTGFTNTGPTGQADDIVLAHGSLVDGMLFLDDTTTPPTLHGHEVETFVPDIAEFFKGGSDLIKNVAANPVTLLTMTEVPGVGTVTNFNNFTGHIQFVTDRPGNGNAFALVLITVTIRIDSLGKRAERSALLSFCSEFRPPTGRVRCYVIRLISHAGNLGDARVVSAVADLHQRALPLGRACGPRLGGATRLPCPLACSVPGP